MLLVSFVIVSQELFQVEVDPETKRPIGTPDPTHPVMVFWFKLLRRYILPALPLIRGNAVCTVDVWNVMRQFEITLRWQLYGEWKTSTYKSHPELRVRQVQTDREAKGILRRLFHGTILQPKHPLALLSVVLDRILSFFLPERRVACRDLVIEAMCGVHCRFSQFKSAHGNLQV